MENKFDIVIVGSGLGGLLCGAFLAKEGKTVCILEKHFQIGGNLQVFKRKGCSFSVGMHYAGALDKGQVLNRVFSYLGIMDRLHIQKLDTNCFEKIIIGNKEYSYAQGMDNFKAKLIEYFPNEKNAIDAYCNKLDEIWENSDLLNLRDLQFEKMLHLEEYACSAFEFIDSLTDNEELKAVLAATNGLYAGMKDKTPLVVHANINRFFIQSAWRIAEDGETLAKLLKEIIKNAGGTVVTNHEVTKFNFNETKIESVSTNKGDCFYAEEFISNIHPESTFALIEKGKLRKAYTSRIEELVNSTSNFTLYVVLKKGQFKHINSNVYVSPDNNIWDQHIYTEDSWPRGYMLYTTEDKENPGYAESIVILSMMNFEDVKEWEHTTLNKRCPEYTEFKKARKEKLLKLAYQNFPELKSAIEYTDCATPLTYRDYTGTKNGSMYGIIKDYNDPMKTFISPKTRIENLSFTGQNINLHGILGVTMSSFLTCSSIIDINSLLRKIREY